MKRRAKTDTDDEALRVWSRQIYPFLKGMSHAQVWANRRKWIASVRYLGPKWRCALRDVRAYKINPLHVVNER